MRNLILIIAVGLMNSCINVDISRSKKRDDTPKKIQLSKNSTITSLGEVNISGHDFYPSGFKIETPEKVIYIDPIEMDDSIVADYIFITHAHPDHFSIESIKKILKKETQIICPKKVAEKLKDHSIIPVQPGDIKNLDGIQFEAVPAFNTKNIILWIKAHPRSAKNVGYIIHIDGIRIYHGGDTDAFPEMKEFNNITMAMVPIGGDNLTMNIEEAASVINSMKPAKVIPMHYELGNNYAQLFEKLIDTAITVEIMQEID